MCVGASISRVVRLSVGGGRPSRLILTNATVELSLADETIIRERKTKGGFRVANEESISLET